MTDRRKNLLILGVLFGILLLCFGNILFTDKIIRAPDIINEYYWAVQRMINRPFGDIFRFQLHADWDIYNNSGNTLEGGGLGNHFLFWQRLLYHLIPPPASVAWFIVLHLFAGAVGVFMLCRAIGAAPLAALAAGLLFALAPENASLINAGHVLKIATICVAPWGFYFLERGFQTRRLYYFLTTGFVLALQFFYTHWQIAYYTCLAIGLYAFIRYLMIVRSERRVAGRLFLLNMATLVFFLTTVSMDLIPLANWSRDTNRGVASGANQGKGGLDVEEAMSWSFPPEELATFAIPGLFGFSRQESGDNPANIRSYYWGRMVFTQTCDYMGLLPWLLLPLPLLFRRDRYTWLALAGLAGGLLFSMGKYTPFYWFLYNHFPGINHFRVPKMIMFIPVISLAILTARGLDILDDEVIRSDSRFLAYLRCLAVIPIVLLLLFILEYGARDYWMTRLLPMLSQPTRYEQGPQLVIQRWNNAMLETAVASAFAAGYALLFFCTRCKNRIASLAPLLLVGLFVVDVGRVNAKFLFLVPEPKESRRNFTTPTIKFLATKSKEYRVLPLNSGSEAYSSKQIPVMFIPMPVQQVRWQTFLDSFSLDSSMPDMLNVKYIVYGKEQYIQDKPKLGEKYLPVFQSPDGSEIVLENQRVLPKAWLVPTTLRLNDPQQILAGIANPSFNPRTLALVEGSAGISLGNPFHPNIQPGDVQVTRYEGELITLTAIPAHDALLVLGEKYYRGWKARVDGREIPIVPVNYILRGVYLTPGKHTVEFIFDPLPFKIGKYLTLASFALFAVVLVREWLQRRRRVIDVT
jgi:hypothetical protein